MIKKIIFCTFLLIFITGCDATYNLKINENSFDEEVNFSVSKDLVDYDIILSYYNSKIPISLDSSNNNDTFYKALLDSDDNNYYLKYHYKHDINTLEDSYFINNCYSDFNFKEEDNQFVISTDQNFKCIYGDDGTEIDSVLINIVTDLKVSFNNADQVVGNTYSWKVDKTNYLNKPINIVMEKEKDNTITETESKTSFNYFSIIPIFAIIGIVIVILLIKNYRSNVIK